MRRLLLALSLALVACAPNAVELNRAVSYKKDIHLNVNGYYNDGVIVVPRAGQYQINGSVNADFDYLIINSCSREYSQEGLGSKFAYTYSPVKGIEDNRACPLFIEGAEKTKGRHSFGFVDFENEQDTLNAESDCDAVHRVWHGVGNCQGPAGGFQRVITEKPTRMGWNDKKPQCNIGQAGPDGKTYVFKMPEGYCRVTFLAEDGQTLRMNLLGYQQTVVRDF